MIVLRPILAIIGAVLLIGSIGLGAFFLAMFAIDRAWPTNNTSVDRPANIGVTTNFLGNARAVFICWEQPDDNATYDILIRHWNLGDEREEVLQGVSPVDCGGAHGWTHAFQADNLYHLELRACVDRRCSEWTPATEGTRFWLQIPCRNDAGNGCYFRGGDSSVRTQ